MRLFFVVEMASLNLMTDLQTIPILRSPNLDESAAFYKRLNFEIGLQMPGYLIMVRKGIELHFIPPDHTDGRATESTCYIRGNGIDALHTEWEPTGLVTPFYHRAWGMYEFYIGDPHGCLLKFGRPADEGPAPVGVRPHPTDQFSG
ncbi:MAG: VOC family protein [Pseudomonadota bacterium]